MRELANLNHAAAQALREPTAWAAGVQLVVALWPFIEWHGFWLAWRAILERALVVCRRLGDLAAEVEITDQLGEVARSVGENRAALDWQEQALGLARRLGDQAIIGRVLVHLSQQHLPQGHYQAAQACCEEAVALLTPLGAEAEIAIAHNNWGIACLGRRIDGVRAWRISCLPRGCSSRKATGAARPSRSTTRARPISARNAGPRPGTSMNGRSRWPRRSGMT